MHESHQEGIRLKVGTAVRHRSRDDIGIGTIISVDGSRSCIVKFANCTFTGVPLDTFISVEDELKREQQKKLRDQVLALLDKYEFLRAGEIYRQQCSSWWDQTEFDLEVQRAKSKQVEQIQKEKASKIVSARERLKAEVSALIDQERFDEADQLYESECSGWWGRSDYELFKSESSFTSGFVKAYQTDSLAALDSFYRSKPPELQLTVDEFVALKISKVQKSLQMMGLTLDPEQEYAISRPEERLLIKARAGSGKTRTLCATAALAIVDEALDPNQVMVLAFNKTAASEVKDRIQGLGCIKDYENARTFHSLAYQLVKSQKKLLFNNGGQVSGREQSRFVQRLIHRILNPAFKEAIVEFFRKELQQVDDIGRDLPPNEYYIFRRALEHVTLKGERVKSNGEKIIADFLFEHGIEYRYEKAWIWKSEFIGGATYKPDFSIVANGHDFILEHWALDPEDPYSRLPEEWDISAAQYKSQILAKRNFWREKSIQLLETSTAMMHGNRQNFELRLQQLLKKAGIGSSPLSKEEIISRVFKNDFAISRLSELFLQFINRSKKRGWSPDEVAKIITRCPDQEPRSQLFHQLALRAYREYEQMLSEENAMDFDDLLMQACEEVEVRGGNASIHLGQGKMIAVSKLKWIMLDEYQDFSELYFRLLSAILNSNPTIRLVGVGDDWQAINAFAGAELRFFEDFADYFPGGEAVGVTTNYRSDKVVVAAGNRLMSGKGTPARVNRNTVGSIREESLDNIWIEFRPDPQYLSNRKADAVYLKPRTDGKNPSESALKQAQALKACTLIICQDPTKKTMLLARTGKIYGLDGDEFRLRLIDALSTLDWIDERTIQQNITVMTAHSSKGQEASRVIILDVTDRQFPKIHPDNLLFELFGVTPQSVLDDERRLFYVAMTRAENELFLITEQGKRSDYLDEIADQSTPIELPEELVRQDSEQLSRLAMRIRQRLSKFDW